MRDKYNHLNKLMLTFTYQDENKYFKMQVINDIKNYITKLIRNTRNENIKYYANIELGSSYNNPHLHIQLYYNDLQQILNIRDKVISKFGLFGDFCQVSYPQKDVQYDYVIKEYNKHIKDEDLLLIDSIKRDYRAYLNKNIRFTSTSKETYTKKIYKKAYSRGIIKANVDTLINDCIINKDLKIIDNRVIEIVKLFILIQIMRELVQYKEQDKRIGIKKATFQYKMIFLYWIYGFI